MNMLKIAKDFETGFQKAPIGMAILRPDLHWITINQEFCSLLGYSHDELWKMCCSGIIHPHEAATLRKFRQSMLGGEMHTAKIETKYMHRSGRVIDVEIRSALVLNEDGSPNYFIDIVEDITESKQARMAAYETAENYRLLVENALDHAIMRIDRQGNISSWNTGAEALFGYMESEIIGQPSSILFTPEDVANNEHDKEMETALSQGQADDDRWHVRKDGSRFWSSGVITPVKDEKGCDNGFVKILRDLTDRKLAQEHHVYLAQHDSLTGLPNRGKFNIELSRIVQDSGSSQSTVAILFIDLDRYKHINDSLGHRLGDALLICVSQRLTDLLDKSAVVARLGGDEFGVIIQGISMQIELGILASRIINALAQSFHIHDHEITIGASIGISLFPKDSQDANQLLTYADMAMSHAKLNGRSNFQFYTDNLDIEAKRRTTIEEELRHAIERHELYLYYQPQISLADNHMCSVEALLRWKNPRLATLAPDEFIALADETGLIVPIGKWVLEQACRQLKIWQSSGYPHLHVAVNVSSRQLEDSSFVPMVDRILKQSGIDPHFLELEITERLLMKDNLRNNETLHALKRRGIQVSVDDFGTGFSSLSYLKHFPVDALKIDKLFIKSLPEDEHDAAIASAIIGMAHSLNLKVVAEGVETEGQKNFLKTLGCNCGQGYLFSEPVPPEQISIKCNKASSIH
jgi:diguanylate cyclase (GGDEF)-like protein/PAS domain S-box-containing protein